MIVKQYTYVDPDTCLATTGTLVIRTFDALIDDVQDEDAAVDVAAKLIDYGEHNYSAPDEHCYVLYLLLNRGQLIGAIDGYKADIFNSR